MGSSGGGSDIPANTQAVNYIRYAPYIEEKHQLFLEAVQGKRIELENSSPFSSFSPIDIDDAFFGAGLTIADYDSVFPLFNTFMNDVDLGTLYDEVFESTTNSQKVRDLIAAEGALLSDDIEQEAIPRLSAGARDINSSQSSTFIIGKSLIESGRQKNLSKFSAGLKYELIPHAVDRWKTTLNWNREIVGTYSDIIKFYYNAKMDMNEHNYMFLSKDVLWPFTLYDHERAALGAMQGARTESTSVQGTESGPSKGQRMASGALSGAAAGAQVGAQIGQGYGVWGALIGAGLGAYAAS